MTTDLKKRILKVTNIGDGYRKEVVPKIRLEGKWLLAAGITPESHVEVINSNVGELILRCLKEQN